MLWLGGISTYFWLFDTFCMLNCPLSWQVNGEYANREYVVPMATHEGALLASYSRGAKAWIWTIAQCCRLTRRLVHIAGHHSRRRGNNAYQDPMHVAGTGDLACRWRYTTRIDGHRFKMVIFWSGPRGDRPRSSFSTTLRMQISFTALPTRPPLRTAVFRFFVFSLIHYMQ